MSISNHLLKIKSSGIYRFVWDKSAISSQQAETLRLVVGYSEKGPFNTPVYIESDTDFKTIYGNISKKLERKGVYFHRIAQQCLQNGPILALNLKPFENEEVNGINFKGSEACSNNLTTVPIKVTDLYDTNRFWTLDTDSLPTKVAPEGTKYMTIVSTDVKNNSCSIFMRKAQDSSYEGISLRTWFSSQSLEIPENFDNILDTQLSDYFMDIYVFKGEFTETLCGEGGELSKYFNVSDGEITLKTDMTDVFGETVDALETLANDSNSNFIASYTGCTLPYFQDANGNYISIDLKFNADYNTHKMLMKLDDTKEELEVADLDVLSSNVGDSPVALKPIYLPGYTYDTINQDTLGTIYKKCMEMLSTKGLRTALTNRVDVEYHYLVDSFDSEATETKKELFTLAKDKDNTFAIVNFPKMSKITSHESYAGNIENVKKIFGVNMPSETEGASYGAYFTQLVFTDGTVKYTVPSAGLVSNLFMNKWGPRQPYYIVAGPTYGNITYSGLVGPDYNFGRSDLDVLEPMGVNAIIYVPRSGTYINSNQTAKQVPISGLSKIHIRELVIYLQDEIENLLRSYQWELNTQTLRDVIKAKADAICETIKNNGGVYAYLNTCDDTNNTAEIIDNEMIILDTEIEPARGAGKMVHQLTIHKTGALTSSIS